MEIRAEVVKDELMGRWKWHAVGAEVWPQPNVFMFSVVSFETEVEAQDDMNEHFRADQDITRRIVRSKGEITKLVKAAVQSCAACSDTEFASPYWHSNDDHGCNWDLNYARGDMTQACLKRVGPTIGHLRAAYNIPNEG